VGLKADRQAAAVSISFQLAVGGAAPSLVGNNGYGHYCPPIRLRLVARAAVDELGLSRG
jgi:hypothetical protein